MSFIECEFFHDKRMKMTVYEMLLVNFIGTESWWYLLKGSFSMVRERIWSFMKITWSILLTRNRVAFIEWELFHDKRTNLIAYEKIRIDFIDFQFDCFYWRELLQDKGRNLTLYEKLLVDFIGTEFGWHLLNGYTFMIRRRI
jgi:hypothetical protein